LQHLPEGRDTVEHGIDLRFDLRQALNPLAQYDRILTYLHEAERLARAIGDTRRLGRVSSYLAQLSWITGRPETAVRSGEQALSLANALGEFALRVASNFYLGRSYQALGEYDRAIDFLQRNVTALQGDLRFELFGVAGLPAALSRIWLAWCLAERGSFTDATARAQEALELAENRDHPFTLTGAYLGVGIVCRCRGLVDQAVHALERARRLCHQHNFPVWLPRVLSFLGSTYALDGRLDEALSYLAQAVDQAASMSRRVDHALFVMRLGEATLLAGDVARAVEHARLAADLAREHRERPHEAYCEWLLGAIAGHQEPPDLVSGGAHYQLAMARAAALGMRPLVAHCHLGLGKLYRRTGKGAEAHEHLTTATAMYSAMDMRIWLEQAEAELKTLV
jgi:tetratricopeptide (TPR) repeat protein